MMMMKTAAPSERKHWPMLTSLLDRLDLHNFAHNARGRIDPSHIFSSLSSPC